MGYDGGLLEPYDSLVSAKWRVSYSKKTMHCQNTAFVLHEKVSRKGSPYVKFGFKWTMPKWRGGLIAFQDGLWHLFSDQKSATKCPWGRVLRLASMICGKFPFCSEIDQNKVQVPFIWKCEFPKTEQSREARFFSPLPHPNSNLANLLKLANKKVPQSAHLSSGEGVNWLLGNAH